MKISMDSINYVTVDILRDNLYRQDDVLLLDCRTNEEYRISHISGSHNIVLPQLMMRRLKSNKLSLKSLVPPNFRQEKDAFLKKCMSYQVVLYDHFTSELNNNDSSMLGLLYNRMKHEGCAVFVLKGGYSKFEVGHPDFCIKAESLSNDADDEDCASDDSSGSPRGGRCSPVSPLSGLAPSVLGLGALTISCNNNNVAEELVPTDFHLPRSRRHMCSCDNRGNCIRHADRFNSEGESDDLNSANSVSSRCLTPISLKPAPFSISSSCRCCTCDKNVRSSPEAVCPSPSVYNNASGPVEILPGLFLGCANDASSAETLSQYNITYILNVTPNLPNVFEADRRYKYKQIPITDHWSQNLSQFFPDAIDFIDEARSKKCGVLVHCLAGISRSVTVTVAYLMQKLRWSLNDAYDFVKQRKNNVSPNFNFMGQLLDFEKTLGLGDYSSPEDVSSANSASSSPPTLFFTSPPPPTPTVTLPVRNMGNTKMEQRTAFILPAI